MTTKGQTPRPEAAPVGVEPGDVAPGNVAPGDVAPRGENRDGEASVGTGPADSR